MEISAKFVINSDERKICDVEVTQSYRVISGASSFILRKTKCFCKISRMFKTTGDRSDAT